MKTEIEGDPMSQIFGEIVKVDIKKAWNHEQYDFTPWLADDENITKLAEALGFELEVEDIEVAVGPYSADILAQSSSSNKCVVIENQFGKTNHDHLGKLLTYGAFLDAGVVIWIAETFTEEHQKALDWLNDHTTKDLEFYGVAIELWKIDQSRPAVRFNVISRPNEIVKKASAAKEAADLTEVKQLQLSFWKQFKERLLERKVVASAQTPRPQYWFDVALGKTGVNLSLIVDTHGSRIGIRVYISNKVADQLLEALDKDKQAIEQEIGQSLQWNPSPENRDKIIGLFRNVDLEDTQQWAQYIDWMVEYTDLFLKAFGPRVRYLNLKS